MEPIEYNILCKFALDKQKSMHLNPSIHSPQEFVNQSFLVAKEKNGIISYKAIIIGLIANTKKKIISNFSLSDHIRECHLCHEPKFSFRFYIKKDFGGLGEDIYCFSTTCIECHNKQNKIYRDKTSFDEALKEQKRVYMARYYAENKDKLLKREKLRNQSPDKKLKRAKWLEENREIENSKRREQQRMERKGLADTYIKSLVSHQYKIRKSEVTASMVINKREEILGMKKAYPTKHF